MNENRLKELREDSDLFQREVAEAIGISERNYSYIETGKTALSDDVLRKFATFYNTSIDYILYMTDDPIPYSKSIVYDIIMARSQKKRKRKEENRKRAKRKKEQSKK